MTPNDAQESTDSNHVELIVLGCVRRLGLMVGPEDRERHLVREIGVDSLSLLVLIELIEDGLGISIPDNDVSGRNFASIASITRYLQQRGE